MKILFTLILTCIIASFVFGQEIINPGFETGTLEGWTQTQGSSSGLSTDAHSGGHSLRIDGRGTVEQIVEGLEKGTDYILRAYVKCGPGGRANPGVKDYGRGKTAAISTDTSWVLVEKSFRTGVESTAATLFVPDCEQTLLSLPMIFPWSKMRVRRSRPHFRIRRMDFTGKRSSTCRMNLMAKVSTRANGLIIIPTGAAASRASTIRKMCSWLMAISGLRIQPASTTFRKWPIPPRMFGWMPPALIPKRAM